MFVVVDVQVLYLLEFFDCLVLSGELKCLQKSSGLSIGFGCFVFIDRIEVEFVDYFGGILVCFQIFLVLNVLVFICMVWQVLCEVLCGSMQSYVGLVRFIGLLLLVCVVVCVNGVNQIVIVIFCYCVIGLDGFLIGYGGGLWCKCWLLEYEWCMGVVGQLVVLFRSWVGVCNIGFCLIVVGCCKFLVLVCLVVDRLLVWNLVICNRVRVQVSEISVQQVEVRVMLMMLLVLLRIYWVSIGVLLLISSEQSWQVSDRLVQCICVGKVWVRILFIVLQNIVCGIVVRYMLIVVIQQILVFMVKNIVGIRMNFGSIIRYVVLCMLMCEVSSVFSGWLRNCIISVIMMMLRKVFWLQLRVLVVQERVKVFLKQVMWMIGSMLVLSRMIFQCLFSILVSGSFIVCFCVSICFMFFDFFSFRWIIMLMMISIVESRNGVCQFQRMKFEVGRVLRVKNVRVVSRLLVGEFCWVKVVYRMFLFLGVFLLVIRIVLFYLLLIVMFWMICSVIREIGVQMLICVQIGNRLMQVVVMFIMIRVIIRVVLWLMWLLRWLKMILFSGWVMKFDQRVMKDSRVVRFGFMLVGKNILLNIRVVVRLQMQKLYYLMVVLMKEVILVLWVFLCRLVFLGEGECGMG